jgi:hypothetical protein
MKAAIELDFSRGTPLERQNFSAQSSGVSPVAMNDLGLERGLGFGFRVNLFFSVRKIIFQHESKSALLSYPLITNLFHAKLPSKSL